MDNTILVYADWQGLGGPRLLGYLHCLRTKATERFDFEYAAAALENPRLQVQIDPRIWATAGRQFPTQGSDTFGVFADASPDRWGRLLMKRRHERDKRVGAVPVHARLYESDFLLRGCENVERRSEAVSRRSRQGALREKQGSLVS